MTPSTLPAALVDVGGQLTSLLGHAHAFRAAGRGAPDADPVPLVLERLLADVLAPLEAAFGDDAIGTTIAVLDATAAAIEDGLPLVPDA